MFNREYFTDDLLESLESVMLRRKDYDALKNDIEKYLKSLPLTDSNAIIIDDLLVDFFDQYIEGTDSYPDGRMVTARLLGNFTVVLHYFKHASNINYRKAESDLMYKAFLGIIEIVVSHNINPDRIIGDRDFTVL